MYYYLVIQNFKKKNGRLCYAFNSREKAEAYRKIVAIKLFGRPDVSNNGKYDASIYPEEIFGPDPYVTRYFN